ncbi:uncharacterized protein LOC132744478 isoform X1 [Ruditapes philippinarum]|uniref:uncharacterized protein LOC132744478 isoform X1 n=1 Tax=Ruditapes philippinarum TaxID=129788 RepID=UPI00295BEB85|nr:uncharacterized protein LOC132744478 isoform X1 [Ruditapes philippinarum]
MKFLISVLLILMDKFDSTDCENSTTQKSQEPRCNSRFDTDYRMFQKLAQLEERQKILQETVKHQSNLIDGFEKQLKESALPSWGDWSVWSDCTLNCSGRHGGRVQSRSRTTTEHSPTKGAQTETEERPCNSVQFAGCIKSYGADDNFGVTYDFADQIAVSTCTALLSGSNYVYAVRRQCSNLAVSCEDTCKNLGKKCFNALHVYRGAPVLPRDTNGALGLYMYKYNFCSGNFCGPNFCCCQN